MRAWTAALLMAFAYLSAPPAAASPSAAAAYASGDFLRAADAGEAAGEPGGLSLAAQALLARCVTDPKDDAIPALLDRAEKNARTALAQQPASVDARLSLALALGIKGKRASVREALAQRYAERGRRLIDEALALDPKSAWAQALLGGWNLEVLRRGGAVGGRLMGARFKNGVAAFDRARALAPDNPAIALHYAVALLSLDPKKHADRAAALLAAAAASPANDAFEARMREEARRIGGALATRGAQAAADLIAETLL
ncbi:MAG: hypothetical protein AB7M12_09180 [Hyphomonadaceae bacterium]